MKPFLPGRYEAVAFGLLLSGTMSFIVSGLSTLLSSGVSADLPLLWLRAWSASWIVAFPTVLVVAPFVRRTLSRIVIRREG
ncbi:DUF2798 domain-containing protein [Ensifer soli]|uniref:DUF2798 domain-containing protein n=1 Tax=Ciceribacter sp. sgz301302 TaxID=3342379 RepID=UPI0035BB0FE1